MFKTAHFVDVIRTDSLKSGGVFSLFFKMGHLEFFPNDGMSQPGCQSFEEFFNNLNISNHKTEESKFSMY